MMDEAPGCADSPEMIARGKGQRTDHLDAEDAAIIADDDGVGIVACDCRAARALQNVAPASNDCHPSDDRGPARMNTRDAVIFRPEPGHGLDIPHRESRVEGR